MASTSETGHAKNVANFGSLTQICVSLGVTYNPSNEAIKVTALQTLLTSGQQAIARVSITYQPYALAVAERKDVFKPISKLVTRVSNALNSSGAPQSSIDIAQTYIRKLHGTRATAKLTQEEIQAIEAQTGKPYTEHSSSQMSMDSNINFFSQLIDLLESIPQYSPNETELQINTLKTTLADLKTKNDAVIPLEAPLNNARANRDALLYTPLTGLVPIATIVKSYLKSILGTDSPIYKSATALKFSSQKK